MISIEQAAAQMTNTAQSIRYLAEEVPDEQARWKPDSEGKKQLPILLEYIACGQKIASSWHITGDHSAGWSHCRGVHCPFGLVCLHPTIEQVV